MPKELEKPFILSWPLWKHLLLLLWMSGAITALIWGFKAFWEPGRYLGFGTEPPTFPPLTIEDIILGSGFSLISLWSRWAWGPRRKHARWHRWLSAWFAGVYVSFLMLLLTIASWNTLLKHPWDWVVNGTFVVLYIVAWMLPALSYRLARKFEVAILNLDLRTVAFVKLGSLFLIVAAGMFAASLGMSFGAEDPVTLIVMGYLGTIVMLMMSLYSGAFLWRYRPWAKEGEE